MGRFYEPKILHHHTGLTSNIAFNIWRDRLSIALAMVWKGRHKFIGKPKIVSFRVEGLLVYTSR